MSAVGTSAKKGKGRRKIEMKKIANENNLNVTFSKRRSGIFKKASELCTLCGVELALIVFSPGGKAFSFGHPNVAAVINRYLSPVPHQTSIMERYIEANRNIKVRDLNTQFSQINNQLDANMKHGEDLSRLFKEVMDQFGWACKVEDMDMSQLGQFKVALNDLKKHVTHYVADIAAIDPPTHHFYDTGSSSNTMIPFNHPPPQVFSHQLLEGPMSQAHNLFGSNNMGAHRGPFGFN